MYVALNSKNEKVHISNSNENEHYYCPMCEEEVIQRKGTINAYHFAHKSNSSCVERDGWHYDMSEWHYDWQNQFPIETQEVVFKIDDRYHRADVFINNTVIEFQHSPISENEFKDRNSFYRTLGHKVIWVFDVLEKTIYHHRNNSDGEIVCSWANPIRFLGNVDYNDSEIEIYLQIGESL